MRDHWEISLIGDDWDIENLVELLARRHLDFEISKSNRSAWVLRGGRLERLDSVEDVRAEAAILLSWLNGFLQIFDRPTKRVAIDSVDEILIDGTRRSSLSASSSVRARGRASCTVLRDGVPLVDNTSSLLEKAVGQAISNPDVGRVLEILNFEGVTWVNLYRAYEVMEQALGDRNGVRKIIGAGKNVDRFARTAHSTHSVGLHARHGVQKEQPPSDPMTLEEARGFILDLFRAFVDSSSQMYGDS